MGTEIEQPDFRDWEVLSTQGISFLAHDILLVSEPNERNGTSSTSTEHFAIQECSSPKKKILES